MALNNTPEPVTTERYGSTLSHILHELNTPHLICNFLQFHSKNQLLQNVYHDHVNTTIVISTPVWKIASTNSLQSKDQHAYFRAWFLPSIPELPARVILRVPHHITKEEVREAINKMEIPYVKVWRIFSGTRKIPTQHIRAHFPIYITTCSLSKMESRNPPCP